MTTTLKTTVMVIILLIIVSLRATSSEEINFTWIIKATNSDVHFYISATKDEKFTVSWGDGTTNTYTGIGLDSRMKLRHQYTNYSKFSVTITSTEPTCLFKELDVAKKSLTSLDLTKATSLSSINCTYNNIDYLDLSEHNSLTFLNCSYNQLSTLKINSNNSLTHVNCENNSLSLANLLSISQKINNSNVLLVGIQKLPTIDVELNKTIIIDSVFHGENTSVSVKKLGDISTEGNDYISTTSQLTFKTSGIYVIEISNPTIVSSLPAKVIATYIAGSVPNQQLSFTWEAGSNEKSITVKTNKRKEFTVNWGDGNSDTITENQNEEDDFILLKHTYSKKDNYNVTITGKKTDCFFLELAVDNCNIKTLDTKGNCTLEKLFCNNNQLTELDLTKNTALTLLSCFNNLISALKIDKANLLSVLNCSYNKLSSLDISQNSFLNDFNCNNNQIVSLDISANKALVSLNCSNNNLNELDITKNTKLNYLECTDNQIKELDLINNRTLHFIRCYNNAIPLDNLYSISLSIYSPNSKFLGTQILPIEVIPVGATINLEDLIQFGNVSTVFSISLNGVTTIDESDFSFKESGLTLKKKGIYEVTMTNDAIISSEDYPAKVIARIDSRVTGVDIDSTSGDSFSIHPNPTSNIIKINGVSLGDMIDIYSLSGNKILSTTSTIIDLSKLPNGIYLVKTGSKCLKMVKL